MTGAVTIADVSSADAIALKTELTDAGLVIEQDYTWTYQPVKYEDWRAQGQLRSRVTFEFRDPAVASFFRIKWTK